MDTFRVIEQAAVWVSQNAAPLLVALAVIALALRLFRPRLDRAARVFHRAGVRVSPIAVQQLRDEFARAAADVERQRVSAENKQQIEAAAIEAEKARILNLVRSTPAVVKEVGEALRAIEREYEQELRAMKSEQAREGLRRTAEKQIQHVLRSVSDESAHLPQFHIPGHTDRERDMPAARTAINKEGLSA